MDSSATRRLIFTLQVASLVCFVSAEELAKLSLYEKPNFQGSVHELTFTNCETVPVRLINKVVSVRSETCIELYESDNCQDGTVITLTEGYGQRSDLEELGFNLGSVKPCATENYSDVGNEHDYFIGASDNRRESHDDQSEEVDGFPYHLAKTTGRPGSHGRGLIEEMDYGENIDTDNEDDDIDDIGSGGSGNGYFQSTPKPVVISEIPINKTFNIQDGTDFVVDEVPKSESHEDNNERSSNIRKSVTTTTTTETPEDVLRQYDGLHLNGSELEPEFEFFDPSDIVHSGESKSTVSPVIIPTEVPTTLKPVQTTMATIPPVLTTESGDVECLITCTASGVADYGMDIKVCAPGGFQQCPGNSTGFVYLKCLQNGTFETLQHAFDNCTAKWVVEMDKLEIDKKQDISPSQAETILTQIYNNVRASSIPARPGHGKAQPVYFGHEIDEIVDIVDATVQKSSVQIESVGQYERICSKSISILDALLSNERSWEQLEQTNRCTTAGHVLDSVETTMFRLGRVAELNSPDKLTTSYEKVFEESSVLRVSTGVFKKSKFDSSEAHILRANVKLPTDWENAIEGSSIRFVGLTLDYNYSSHLLPTENTRFDGATAVLGSEIFGLSLANEFSDKPLKVLFLGEGVKINFHLRDQTATRSKHKQYREPICAYWDPHHLIWATDGCKLLQSDNSNVAICECSHLTLFAVLMDVHGYTNYVRDATLYTLTIVLCVLSTICLLVTIMVLKILRSAKSPSTSITIQLCACLLIGNILIITVLDRNTFFKMPDTACAVSALFLHYILLCAFAWMAIEGFVVLKMVLDVFNTGTEHKMVLGAVAYGVPFLIVCALGVLHFLGIQHVYGDEMFCWLEGYYVLTFIIPVALVVLGNSVALSVAIHVARKADKRFSEQTKKHRTWIIGTCALTSILGLTWMFGFLLLIGDPKFSRIASYIFTAFNASQGIFVFMFHCVLNRKVRTALKQRVSPRSRVSEQSHTSSRQVKSLSSRNDTSERRVTELTSKTEEKREINVHVETVVEREESEEEIETRRRFLRSRSSSDDISRKPAFYKYLEQNQGRKEANDPAFM